MISEWSTGASRCSTQDGSDLERSTEMRTRRSDRVSLPARSRARQSAVKWTTNSILRHEVRASERAYVFANPPPDRGAGAPSERWIAGADY